MIVAPGSFRPAPLNYTTSRILARPCAQNLTFDFCKAINWQHVNVAGMVSECVRDCTSADQTKNYQ